MITASIVLYKHEIGDIERVLDSLLMSPVSHIYIIDHSNRADNSFVSDLARFGQQRMASNSSVRLRAMKRQLLVTYHKHQNTGYGAGHNVALCLAKKEGSTYHLVVNPDVWFEADVIPALVAYMDNNSEVGQIMPKVLFPDGSIQTLCKLLPTPWDMFSRLCLPAVLINKRNAIYELQHSGYDKIMEVPYLSGCFMFFRMSAVDKVGLFDEHFFMYAEDIDMTRRMYEKYKTIFYPEVKIFHRFSRASRHSLRLFFVHLFNIIMYFNKWGWLFDKKRKEINHKTLKAVYDNGRDC